MDKNELRKHMKNVRNSILPDRKEQYDKLLYERVKTLPEFCISDVVLSYSSFGNEPDMNGLNNLILKNKVLFLPKVYKEKREMLFYKTDSLSDLKSGYAGILEPKGGMLYDDYLRNRTGHEEKNIKVCMIMPGLAFDEGKGRIGYGGGYYDRFIREHEESITHILMPVYEELYIDNVPMEAHDRKPDMIITQDRIIT